MLREPIGLSKRVLYFIQLKKNHCVPNQTEDLSMIHRSVFYMEFHSILSIKTYSHDKILKLIFLT